MSVVQHCVLRCLLTGWFGWLNVANESGDFQISRFPEFQIPWREMTSLDEQLTWLRQKPREAMMYGFGYAPAASTHLLCESNLGEHVFDFSARHIASSISSLSASGMTDLQSFRSNEVTREGAQRMPSVEVVSDESDIPDSALMEIDIDSESLACLHCPV